MPRIHTGAVIWYSGTPTRLPLRSSGLRIPLFAETKMQEWRKKGDGETGRGRKERGGKGGRGVEGGGGGGGEGVEGGGDIAEASNSRLRIMRKNVSSTG